MKKVIIALWGCVIFLASCKEEGPAINFKEIVIADTTFEGTAPTTTDPHNVLAEEFTGQSCPNCPAAHDLLASLSGGSGGRLISLGMYMYGLVQAIPPSDAIYDFRDSSATKIANTIFLGGPGAGIPCAGIDRVPVSGSLVLYTSSWSDAFNQRKTITDSVNMSVVSVYNTADSTAKITVTTVYTQNVTTSQNLSVAIVEDSLVDVQETATGFDDHYLFTNVFRGFVSTVPYGDPVASQSTTKHPGTTNQKTYVYKVNPAWNTKRCRVVAFVHYSNLESNKDVWQTVQCKLAP